MNLFISLLVILMFIEISVRRINYIRKLKISTKKSFFNYFCCLAGITIFIVITLLYAKNTVHYFIGTLGIVFWITEFIQQGIFNEGIFVIARSKERYFWHEISNVQILKKKDLKITFSCNGTMEVTQKYDIKEYENIVNLFIKNNVNYYIKYN